MTHSEGLSSSNLSPKYKTPVTPIAYSSVNSQKMQLMGKKKKRHGKEGKSVQKILPQTVNLPKLSRETTPHRTGQALKHSGRRTLHLAATWTWGLCLRRGTSTTLRFFNRHCTNSKTDKNGRIRQRMVTVLQQIMKTRDIKWNLKVTHKFREGRAV